MDIEKLIEQLRSEAATFRPDSFAQTMLLDAATALSMIPALQAENKQLKNKLSELAHLPFDEPGIGERTRLMAENAELRAELEQVNRERDAAVEFLESAIRYSANPCEGCKADCVDAGSDAAERVNQCGAFEWRGQKED